jgi:hypothetical protein
LVRRKTIKKNVTQLAIEGGSAIFPQPLGQNLPSRKVGDAEAKALVALVRNGLRDDTVGEFG